MEAFMYHFHPRTERAREVLEAELGERRYVTATFTFRMPDGADDSRPKPELAGGALMDVGRYCVSPIRNFLGEPDRVYAAASDTRESGVDTQLLATLTYEDGPTANVACGFDTRHVERYRVETADGWLDPGLFQSTRNGRSHWLTASGRTGPPRRSTRLTTRLEVEAFADAVAAGRDPPVSREESVANMRVVDALYAIAERGGPIALD